PAATTLLSSVRPIAKRVIEPPVLPLPVAVDSRLPPLTRASLTQVPKLEAPAVDMTMILPAREAAPVDDVSILAPVVAELPLTETEVPERITLPVLPPPAVVTTPEIEIAP